MSRLRHIRQQWPTTTRCLTLICMGEIGVGLAWILTLVIR